MVDKTQKIQNREKLPNGWRELPIGETLRFKNGLNKAKSYFGHGTPIINYMDVYRHSGLCRGDVQGKVSVTRDEITNYGVKKGDVLFTRTSETPDEIGMTSVLLEDIPNAVFSGFVLRGRPQNHDLDLDFCKYCFNAEEVRKQIISRSSYTTRALTSGGALSRVVLKVPESLSEQQAIASVLSDIDKLIRDIVILIAKKQDVRFAAMQQLVSGKRRLLSFKKKWKKYTLNEIQERIVGGGTPSRANSLYWGGKIPWATVKDFASFNRYRTQEQITREGLNNSASHLIPQGTLIIATRIALGNAVIYEVDVAINQDLKALFFKKDIHNRFMYYWFQVNAKTIAGLGSGSTVMGISLPDLKAIEISIPEHEEQMAIATVLSDMDAEIEQLNKTLEKYRVIKAGMMQQLLTGRIRV